MRICLSLLALIAVAAPAFAGPQSQIATFDVRVSYDDLDLADDADRATLENRVARQLRRACTIDNPSSFAFGSARRDKRCMAEGLAAAKAELARVTTTQQRRGRAVAAN